MSAPERFIEVATRPLAETNAELQLAAAHELQQHLDPGDSAAIDRATATLEGRPTRNRWIPTLLILMAVISLPLILSSLVQFLHFRGSAESLSSFSPTPQAPSSHLTPQQSLLLYGNPSLPDPERWKALWQSRPDHPPYFAEYVARSLTARDTLPPDFLETAEEIDPDNGWYWAIAAAYAGKDNATQTKPNSPDYDLGKASDWTIKDPAKHAAALELIRLAATKPRFTNYSIELLKERIPLLPARTDYPSQFPRIAYVASGIAPNMKLRPMAEVIATEARRCETENDLKAYQHLRSDYRTLIQGQLNDADTIIDGLLSKVLGSQPLRNLRDAAETLDLPDEAEAFNAISLITQPTREQKRAKRYDVNPTEIICLKQGSAMSRLALPIVNRQLKHPIAITEADIKPARRAEHALFGRVACLAIWAVLGLMLAAAALFRTRHGPVMKVLSTRTLDLLTRRDWIWILAGGTVAPILWHFIITYLTPLTAHDWNMSFVAFLQPTGQFAATGWLMVVTPVVIARWRLAKRAGFLGMQMPHAWIGWTAVATTALALPCFGLLMSSESTWQSSFEIAWGLLGFSILWTLIVATRALFGKPQRALQRQSIARLLVPAYALGMILAIACVPVLHIEERHWMQQDHLMEVSADEPSMTSYEYRAAQQLKAELLETFSPLPE